MSNEEVKEQARKRFTEYLEAHGQRKTPERYAILDAVYSSKGHFDMEELHRTMTEATRFHVSRATLYNTIDLLTEAGLVVKHQFGDHTSHYERSLQTTPHHHLVCTQCGKVTDFVNAELEHDIAQVRTPGFQRTSYTLYIYGLCADCATAHTEGPKH